MRSNSSPQKPAPIIHREGESLHIYPKGGKSYPDRVVMESPCGTFLSFVRRGSGEFLPNVQSLLRTGYTVVNAILTKEETQLFGLNDRGVRK